MRLTKANSKAVRYACTKFHYSKSVPAYRYAYNVYNNKEEWCGVILYGDGVNMHIAENFDLKTGEILELERVALNGKQEKTSKAVALSLKLLHKEDPIIKIVISYADNRQKHLGIIYQATNWIYIEKVLSTGYQYFYNGKWKHKRTINSQEKTKKIREQLPKRKNGDKFKYVYCFDKELKEKYLKEALPYPRKEDLTIEVD